MTEMDMTPGGADATGSPSRSARPRGPKHLISRLYQFFRAGGITAALAAAFVVFIVVCALFAHYIAPYSPDATHILVQLSGPGTHNPSGGIPFLLGTDDLGRDELSRLIYGSQISLAVGAASVLVSGLIGVTLGLIAGYFKGFADGLISRLVDLQMALPSLLIALFILYAIGSSTLNVVIVLAVTRWPIYTRLVRGIMLSLRERMFFEALSQFGVSHVRSLVRHGLPNALGPVVTLATLEMANMILIEASLDFLGLGVQPPASSWGLMLSDGLPYLTSAWWLVTMPGIAIMLTTLSFVLLANRLGVRSDRIKSVQRQIVVQT